MKIKSFLIMVLSLISLTVAAQNGGIKGKVVSRATRTAIDGVKVTLTPGNVTTTTDEKGNFIFESLNKGEYSLAFEAAEYEPLSIAVRVDKLIRDINNVVLVPDNQSPTVDDAIFAEFDTETLDDAQSLPSSLSASKDVFNNIASYKFSEMRFNLRGYDSRYTDVYLNGILFNDALTGYSPWSLWSGLNDATRNQEVTSGLNMGEMGIGSLGGTTNINTRPSQMRKGFRASLVNGNSTYRFRGMVTYASGLQDNGWSYAFSVSTRQGGNSYARGVYYNAFGYFAAVEKQFNDQHRLALSVLGAPTERGTQQAATQEVYDLVGNNYYNPNWGWQSGKRRNARVRNYHEPIAVLNYTYDINDRSQLNVATSVRFGENGYSALTWYAGPDPRPDYYRYLPSYSNGTTYGAWLDEAWRANTDNIRHINWGQLYDINRNQEENATYGPGHRSINMIEERHTDQLDWNFYTQFSHTFRNNSRINGAAYKYAQKVLKGEAKAPKYVILQCAEFLQIANGKSRKYTIDEEKLERIMRLLRLMVMPKGLKAYQTVADALAGFQWLFIVAVLCTVYRSNREKRRYQTAILEICRKNGKTFLVAVLFILLLLTEPKFSKFYSVAPDGSLSREVKTAIEEIIRSSPARARSARTSLPSRLTS